MVDVRRSEQHHQIKNMLKTHFNSSCANYEMNFGVDEDALEVERITLQMSQREMAQQVRASEDAFKERYNFLKRVYEERLDSILSQIKYADSTLKSDPLLGQLFSSAETIQFAGNRVQEIVLDTLSNEREKYIVQLAEDMGESITRYKQLESDYQMLSQSAEEVKQHQEQRIARLKQELRMSQQECEKVSQSSKELQAKYEKTSSKVEHRRVSHSKDRDLISTAKTRLIALVMSQNTLMATQMQGRSQPVSGSSPIKDTQSLQHLTLLELVDQVESILSIKDKWAESITNENNQTRLEEADKEKSIMLQDYAELQEHSRSLEKHIEFLTKECESLGHDLELAERDREEVKINYMNLGTELKKALNESHANQAAVLQSPIPVFEKELKRVSSRNETLEKQVEHLKSQNQQLERKVRKLKDSAAVEGSRDPSIDATALQSVVEEHKRLHDESKASLQTEIDYLKQKQHKLKDKHKASMESLEKTYSEKVQKLENELRKLESSKQEALRKLERKLSLAESKASEIANESQVKMYEQLNKLTSAKNQELKAQQRELQLEMERKVREIKSEQEGPSHEAAAVRIATLLQDHMPVGQHEQVVNAQLSALRAELNQLHGERIEQTRMEHQRELKNLEAKKDQEFTMSMVNIREGIKKLENQLNSEKEQRKQVEELLTIERRTVNQYREKADDEEQGKRDLLVHLEEANTNILRLKTIVQNVSDRANNLETNTKELERSKQAAEIQVLEMARRVQDLETRLALSEEKRQDMESATANKQTNWSEVASNLAHTKYELGQLKEERNRLVDLLKSADSAKEQAVEAVRRERQDRAGSATQELAMKLEQQHEKLTEAQTQIANLEEELRSSRSKSEDLANQKENLSVALATMRAEQQVLLKEVREKDDALTTSNSTVVELQSRLQEQKNKISKTIEDDRETVKQKDERIRALEQLVKKHQLLSSRNKVRILNQVSALVRPVEQQIVVLASSTKGELESFQSDMKRVVMEMTFKYRDAVGRVQANSEQRLNRKLEKMRQEFEQKEVHMQEEYTLKLEEMEEKYQQELRLRTIEREEDHGNYNASLAEAVQAKEEEWRNVLDAEREKWDAMQATRIQSLDELQSRFTKLQEEHSLLETQLADKVEELHESEKTVARRLHELEHSQTTLKQTQIDISKLEGECNALREELVVQTKSSTELSREVDVRRSNLMAMAVALSSEVPVPQEVLDGLSTTDAIEFNRFLKKLHAAIRDHVKTIGSESRELLQSKVEESKEKLEKLADVKDLEIRQLRDEIAQFQDTQAASSEEILQLRNQLKAQEEESSRLESELEEYKMELFHVTSDRDEIHELSRMEIDSKERTFEGRLDEERENREMELAALARKHQLELQQATSKHSDEMQRLEENMREEIEVLQRQLEDSEKRTIEIEQEKWKVEQASHSSISVEKAKVESLQRDLDQYKNEVAMIQSQSLVSSPSSRRRTSSFKETTDMSSPTSMRRGSQRSSVSSMEEFKGESPSHRRRRRSSFRRVPSMRVDVDNIHLKLHENGEIEMNKDDESSFD